MGAREQPINLPFIKVKNGTPSCRCDYRLSIVELWPYREFPRDLPLFFRDAKRKQWGKVSKNSSGIHISYRDRQISDPSAKLLHHAELIIIEDIAIVLIMDES